MTALQKPKIERADYELIFIRINSIYDRVSPRTKEFEQVFEFEHIKNRFKPTDHTYSRDKDAISHCYHEIQQDKYYFIFTQRMHELREVKKDGRIFHRWVWRAAVELDDKQIRLAYEFFLNNSDAPKEVSKYIDSLKNPSVTKLIDGFEYGGQNANVS